MAMSYRQSVALDRNIFCCWCSCCSCSGGDDGGAGMIGGKRHCLLLLIHHLTLAFDRKPLIDEICPQCVLRRALASCEARLLTNNATTAFRHCVPFSIDVSREKRQRCRATKHLQVRLQLRWQECLPRRDRTVHHSLARESQHLATGMGC